MRTRFLALTMAAVLAVLLGAHLALAAGVGQATPPDYALPPGIAELLTWVYGSSFSISILRRIVAFFDANFANGAGAAVTTLVVNALAVTYGATDGAFGGAPEGVEGWLGRVALMLLSTWVAYKANIGKLIPDPPTPAPAPSF